MKQKLLAKLSKEQMRSVIQDIEPGLYPSYESANRKKCLFFLEQRSYAEIVKALP